MHKTIHVHTTDSLEGEEEESIRTQKRWAFRLPRNMRVVSHSRTFSPDFFHSKQHLKAFCMIQHFSNLDLLTNSSMLDAISDNQNQK